MKFRPKLRIFVALLAALPAMISAAGDQPIAELYLFPRERLTADTFDAYREAVTSPAWAKFDKLCVYGALPSNAELFKTFLENVRRLAELPGRELAYQAPTIGSGGWEQYAWTRNDFWSAQGTSMPSAFLGLDIESLKMKRDVPSAERAAQVRAYLQEFIRAADARHVQKDVWYTGSWEHFAASGKSAPLIFTPELVSQLDRVHWMDLPKLLTTFGDEAAYCKQVERLLATSGPEKTFLQVGFLNDLDMAGNAARARRMMELAQQLGVSRFTVYVKLSAMHDPVFQQFYDALNKEARPSRPTTRKSN